MARLDSSTFPLLKENIISELRSKRIYTVYDFMAQSCENLTHFTGLTFKEIESLRKEILDKFGGTIVNPIDLLKREISDVFSTGVENLDNLLNGGLHCGQIYEICGLSAAGKSQLCLTCSVHLTSSGAYRVHYIDTCRNFCPSRIQIILESKQSSLDVFGQVMSNIILHRISKLSDLFTVLHGISQLKETEKSPPIKLVIIDSLPIVFSASASNVDGMVAQSQLASVCKYIVNRLGAAIITTNSITRWREADGFRAVNDADVIQVNPALGKFWSSIPNTRLLVEKLQQQHEKRKITVWKSLDLRLGSSCFVKVTDNGVEMTES